MNKKNQTATAAFHECPWCGSSDLIEVKTELLCAHCDWDSTFWSTNQGLMDDIDAAAAEWFGDDSLDEDHEYILEERNSQPARKGA